MTYTLQCSVGALYDKCMTTKNTSFRVTPAEKEAIVALLANIRSNKLILLLPDKLANAVVEASGNPAHSSPSKQAVVEEIANPSAPAHKPNPIVIKTVDEAVPLLAMRAQRQPLLRPSGKM